MEIEESDRIGRVHDPGAAAMATPRGRQVSRENGARSREAGAGLDRDVSVSCPVRLLVDLSVFLSFFLSSGLFGCRDVDVGKSHRRSCGYTPVDLRILAFYFLFSKTKFGIYF